MPKKSHSKDYLKAAAVANIQYYQKKFLSFVDTRGDKRILSGYTNSRKLSLVKFYFTIDFFFFVGFCTTNKI